MAETFKKGQIVPRRLGRVLCNDRKAQHCVTFGCDVHVDGHVFTALSDGPAIYVKPMSRRMNNGTLKNVRCTVEGIHLHRPDTRAPFVEAKHWAMSPNLL